MADDDTVRRDVVGVVGAGTMGAGIAQVAAMAGHETRLVDAAPGAAAHAVETARARIARLAEKGRLTAADAAAASARLRAVDDLAALAGAALVVEAIVENLAAKQALFVELEARLG
ncbi:MAG TPA: 3-hydroxyacyl-CoA dehydrogenase NAD-binding domain-containing protein, partial [Actinomycetes bacterium]|nr:3-hydroxyacyl-CoA dehydrogenase NAD-binding domain-containing protein [Actinomycetes bacterium]